MAVRLNPYLHFDGEAADAVAFYADVFGGTTSVMTFAEMGMEGPDAQKVMHGQLETEQGMTLMVADMPPGTTRERGNDVTVALSGDDEPTLRGWYEQLSAGGTVGTPLEKQMWGDFYGDCTDRFGVRWMVNISAAG
ncbi:VOC family protein [Actinomycetospora straminea]|uniref:VOC family protein n=1 Tax=Actinomycetospora straminea TaxID=663607 RepID=A0ABP9E6L6_9PSEU|nr:VOC family protein [Actinomycetospora straminea]MDD7932715.1 VOC family protein [Actinomycetospora straminea]